MLKPFDRIRELKKTLSRNPSIVEIRQICTPVEIKEIQAEYGTYSNLMAALHNPHLMPILPQSIYQPNSPQAIADSEKDAAMERRLENKYRSACSRKEQIQGFFRHVIDLDDLFAKHGNPTSLKMIAQPDTHAKFVDRPAFNAFTKFCGYYKAHIHMIMGDFADCEGVAHWDNDSMEPRRLVPEMKISRALLKEIIDVSRVDQTRLFLEGNHEYWIQMWLNQHPEFFDGLEDLGYEINLRTLLALDKFGFELFPLNHLVKIGKAHFTHGIFTTQHHAKKMMDTFKGNIYYGHLHDTQTHNQTSLDGHMEAASLGCLCRLDAKFLKAKPNNWVHAFGIYEFFRDGSYTFLRPSITNGRFSYNGQIFDGN